MIFMVETCNFLSIWELKWTKICNSRFKIERQKGGIQIQWTQISTRFIKCWTRASLVWIWSNTFFVPPALSAVHRPGERRRDSDAASSQTRTLAAATAGDDIGGAEEEDRRRHEDGSVEEENLTLHGVCCLGKEDVSTEKVQGHAPEFMPFFSLLPDPRSVCLFMERARHFMAIAGKGGKRIGIRQANILLNWTLFFPK